MRLMKFSESDDPAGPELRSPGPGDPAVDDSEIDDPGADTPGAPN